MGKRDPRVDAYIARSADFAKPILSHIRDVVHSACPPVEETLKWSVPAFMYKGNLCGMAAFKHHCMFGFWTGSLIVDKKTGMNAGIGMGRMRITSLAELPSDRILTDYVRQAMKLNEEGVKAPRTAARPKKPLPVPASMKKALGSNKQAMKTFQDFSPSHQREYIEWITEAKTDETRERRLSKAIEMIAEGKPRNWKYMKR
jgi:uncharacterized protein YdeI (YjbR/CyaY-like superfamily)